VLANKWLLTKMRSRQADAIALRPVRHEGFESLAGVETCLVVTYRKDGHPVGVGAATICGPTDLIQRCPVSVGYEFEVNLSVCL
jgi:hypothetical protein